MTPFSQFLQQQTPGAGVGRMPFTGDRQYGLPPNPQQALQNLFRMLGIYKTAMTQQQPGRPSQQPQSPPMGNMPSPQHVQAARQQWLKQSNPASATMGPRY